MTHLGVCNYPERAFDVPPEKLWAVSGYCHLEWFKIRRRKIKRLLRSILDMRSEYDYQ